MPGEMHHLKNWNHIQNIANRTLSWKKIVQVALRECPPSTSVAHSLLGRKRECYHHVLITSFEKRSEIIDQSSGENVNISQGSAHSMKVTFNKELQQLFCYYCWLTNCQLVIYKFACSCLLTRFDDINYQEFL